MKSPKYPGRLLNVKWLIFPPAATPFALLLVLFMVSACTTLRNDQPKDALYTQVYNDMMYGTDDYFGQSMDLAYADGVVPRVVQPVFVTSETAAARAATPVAATPVAAAPVAPVVIPIPPPPPP
jgi:hypothetical protein